MRESPDGIERVRPFLQQAFEEAARPFVFGVIRTGSDEAQLAAVLRNPRGELAILRGIFGGSHIAPATPRFVANTPVANVERILTAARRAKIGERGTARGRIAVFDPAIEIGCGKAAKICREKWLAAGQFAELDEFVGAEFVGIVFLQNIPFVADERI